MQAKRSLDSDRRELGGGEADDTSERERATEGKFFWKSTTRMTHKIPLRCHSFRQNVLTNFWTIPEKFPRGRDRMCASPYLREKSRLRLLFPRISGIKGFCYGLLRGVEGDRGRRGFGIRTF